MHRVRIFISSPGDVTDERQRALAVVERLQEEFIDSLQLEPLLWEQEPLLATADFQSQIRSPADFDVFATIIGARLGSPLGAGFTRRDGTPYASGTEFEFEVAIASHFASGTPEMLVYRKAMPASASASTQLRKVDSFFDKWYREGSDFNYIGAYHSFERSGEFEQQFHRHLRETLQHFLPRPNNLATPISSFVGRYQQVCEITDYLTGPTTDAVNLVGPAGVGKSRLALRAARAALASFPQGVFLVDLEACSDTAAITAAILEVLGEQVPTAEAVGALEQALAARQLLLVLDNVEAPKETANLLAHLQSRCSGLSILLASVDPLPLAQLRVEPVEPLQLPAPQEKNFTAICENDAVRLFADRASGARDGFSLNPENAAEVVAICRRLNGMPRTIEMAASRMRTLNAKKILRSLDSLKVKNESGQTVYLIPR